MYRGRNKRPAARPGRSTKRSNPQKVGSSTEAAKQVAKEGDFGVPASDPNADQQRRIASQQSRHRHKNQQGEEPRSSLSGTRTAGVGGPDSGPGSSSGGDIDPDITGVGTEGSGIAQTPPRTDDRSEQPGQRR